MNYLLFFISIIFSFIFYIFHLSNVGGSFLGHDFSLKIPLELFSGSLLIETTVFLLIAVFFFLGFSSYEKKINSKPINLTKINLFIIDFFKKYLYYIGFLFAYTGIYFILKSYNFSNVNIFILFVNIIVFLLFFITKKFFIFRDFIKVNTILFSLFYIFLYIYNIITKDINFLFIDFLNGVLIFSFFILNFYNDKKLLNQKADESLIINLFIYTLLFTSYYFLLLGFSVYFGITLIGILLSIFIYFFVIKLDFFKNNKILLRSISFLFLYISSFAAMIFFIKYSFNFIVLLALLYSSIFNFKIHNKFENYISLIISFLIPIFLIFYLYFKVLSGFDDGFIFLILSLGVSIEIIILTYFYSFKYSFDNYFIHLISYIVNIVSLIYYFIVFEFDFFIMGVILFFEAIIAFSSYYKLKQKNKSLTN